MSYKVNYYTLAIMPDGTYGNVKQSAGVCYTDHSIHEIPEMLNRFYGTKQKHAVITRIEEVTGFCLSYKTPTDGKL